MPRMENCIGFSPVFDTHNVQDMSSTAGQEASTQWVGTICLIKNTNVEKYWLTERNVTIERIKSRTEGLHFFLDFSPLLMFLPPSNKPPTPPKTKLFPYIFAAGGMLPSRRGMFGVDLIVLGDESRELLL